MDDLSLLIKISRLLPSKDACLHISTKDVGAHIGLSQQSASRLLASLSHRGLIEKRISGRGHTISLTPEALEILKTVRNELDDFLEKEGEYVFSGVVAKGLGEGAYYVREYEDKIIETLGFKPYSGTLNIKLGKPPHKLRKYTDIDVWGFTRQGRSYGNLRLARVIVSAGREKVDCYFVLPERTHHREEAEFISQDNLRKALDVSDGSPVEVSFRTN